MHAVLWINSSSVVCSCDRRNDAFGTNISRLRRAAAHQCSTQYILPSRTALSLLTFAAHIARRPMPRPLAKQASNVYCTIYQVSLQCERLVKRPTIPSDSTNTRPPLCRTRTYDATLVPPPPPQETQAERKVLHPHLGLCAEDVATTTVGSDSSYTGA